MRGCPVRGCSVRAWPALRTRLAVRAWLLTPCVRGWFCGAAVTVWFSGWLAVRGSGTWLVAQLAWACVCGFEAAAPLCVCCWLCVVAGRLSCTRRRPGPVCICMAGLALHLLLAMCVSGYLVGPASAAIAMVGRLLSSCPISRPE